MPYLKKIFFLVVIFGSIHNIYSQKKIKKSETEWKKELSPIQFYVLRQKGTEKPNSGVYNKHYEKGTYYCAGCETPLFSSKNKYNSYSGWPSFDDYIKPNLRKIEDLSLGMKRIEIVCNVCNGHLGHVFDDGPKNTTGKRYCVNSVSLKFTKSLTTK